MQNPSNLSSPPLDRPPVPLVHTTLPKIHPLELFALLNQSRSRIPCDPQPTFDLELCHILQLNNRIHQVGSDMQRFSIPLLPREALGDIGNEEQPRKRNWRVRRRVCPEYRVIRRKRNAREIQFSKELTRCEEVD